MTTRQEVAAKLLAALMSSIVREFQLNNENYREELCNAALDWADTLLTMEREQ